MRRLLAFACALIGAALVFTLLSCDGEVPVAPDGELLDSNLTAQALPALHSVTGQATTWYSGGYFVLAMNARHMPDGTAGGNFHWLYRSREPGTRIFVKVSCLTVVGDEAWMVGQASQAGNPNNIGRWFGLYVADNGEGVGASPDLIAHRWLGTDSVGAMAFCTGTPGDLEGVRAVEAGNIQVR
ncbi:MAG: hypothetical protein Q8W45_09875 [Candidatus Palauibacterales bacterium]|nr:hypothetical protein [Candidatus Palauibacterales bacterium]MDP2483580.1 hypothetical protein [Candidatus Palauibacterales bacterium]